MCNNIVLYLQIIRNRESITKTSTQVTVNSIYSWLFLYTCLKFTIYDLFAPCQKKKKKKNQDCPEFYRQRFCKKLYGLTKKLR